MTSLTRWDPFHEMTSLRDAVNELMEQAVLRPGLGGFLGGSGYGSMNVIELEGKYLCQVLLPGVQSDQIELTARQNTLTIKAKVPEFMPDEQLKNATWLLHEFSSGEFSRTVTFPKDINSDAIEAHYEHGVLAIGVPLAQHAQPRRITINSAPSNNRGNVTVEGSSSKQLAGSGV